MKKKSKLLVLLSTASLACVGAVALIGGTVNVEGLGAESSGETNTFTLTRANLTSYEWNDEWYCYDITLTGSSLHHGEFTSVDSTVYGNYAIEEGYVNFNRDDCICLITGDVEYQGAGAALFCFEFDFTGITQINYCTFVYYQDAEEFEGVAYIDGSTVYYYLSNDYGYSYLKVVSITISYSC